MVGFTTNKKLTNIRVLTDYFTETFLLQHKLKSSQKEKVRQFIAFTQTNEKGAIACLGSHDWKLDLAVDNYFQAPERYNSEPSRSAAVDRKKLEALWQRYRGIQLLRFEYLLQFLCLLVLIFNILKLREVLCRS